LKCISLLKSKQHIITNILSFDCASLFLFRFSVIFFFFIALHNKVAIVVIIILMNS